MNSGDTVYRVRRTEEPPSFTGNWSGGAWAAAEPLRVEHFHPAGSEHRPKTEAKILYDAAHLYVFFRVNDRFIRAVADSFQGPVCADSCVEAFFSPREDGGYFNFEMNCGGTLLLYYIEDPRRTEEGFARFTPVAAEQVAGMRIYHSLPARVAYLGKTVDPSDQPAGGRWRGNFYKCGDETSHPHWASWSPIGEELNFHCPEHFGILEFEER